MERFRVIQVGAGQMVHSEHLMRAMRRRADLFAVAGIVVEDEARWAKVRDLETFRGLERLTWEEAVARRPDAFMIETDEHQLVPAAIRSLEAGFPTYMDKPGSENGAEFHRMCRLAETKKLPLTLGYMYRTNPAVLYALEMKRTGKFGRIFSVEAQMSRCADAPYHRTLQRFRGGMMYYLGCHLIDLVVQFCGFPEEIVPFNVGTGLRGVECLDCGFAVLRYRDGVSFVKTAATELNGVNRRSLVICGEKATVEIRPLEIPRGGGLDDTVLYVTDNNQHPSQDGRRQIEFPPHYRYDLLLENFVNEVRGKTEPAFPPKYEAALHDLILQACGVALD